MSDPANFVTMFRNSDGSTCRMPDGRVKGCCGSQKWNAAFNCDTHTWVITGPTSDAHAVQGWANNLCYDTCWTSDTTEPSPPSWTPTCLSSSQCCTHYGTDLSSFPETLYADPWPRSSSKSPPVWSGSLWYRYWYDPVTLTKPSTDQFIGGYFYTANTCWLGYGALHYETSPGTYNGGPTGPWTYNSSYPDYSSFWVLFDEFSYDGSHCNMWGLGHGDEAVFILYTYWEGPTGSFPQRVPSTPVQYATVSANPLP